MKTKVSAKKELSPKQRDELLAALKARFDANKARHPGLVWAKVQARLEAKPDQLWSLAEMERTGGEPDVVGQDKKSGEVIFFDCAPESPAGRRSACYDRVAVAERLRLILRRGVRRRNSERRGRVGLISSAFLDRNCCGWSPTQPRSGEFASTLP